MNNLEEKNERKAESICKLYLLGKEYNRINREAPTGSENLRGFFRIDSALKQYFKKTKISLFFLSLFFFVKKTFFSKKKGMVFLKLHLYRRVVVFCAERDVCVGNTHFKHRRLHKYKKVARFQDGVEIKGMIDLVLVKREMLRYEEDVRVVRRMGRDLSYHHVVLCKVRLVGA